MKPAGMTMRSLTNHPKTLEVSLVQRLLLAKIETSRFQGHAKLEHVGTRSLSVREESHCDPSYDFC